MILRTYRNATTLVLLAFLFFIASAMPASGAQAKAPEENSKWRYLGKTDENQMHLFYDPQSVKQTSKGFAQCLVKKELTPEGVKEFRKKYDAMVQKAERESGGKVEDSETLFKMLVRSETKVYTYKMNCRENTYTIGSEAGVFNTLLLMYPVREGSTEEQLKQKVCSTIQ
ncbi:MAG: hypothetical protein K8I29_12415 [Alphaproteobacteria bacterium]|uniref:Uncharacterized protein n=1 Tax=Candidatus Nitrobium versatile TaxID=2884831 RepID=A0A953JE50_9BACT|nr:hypothetical protein [Candidatus Nitrobium versatile]